MTLVWDLNGLLALDNGTGDYAYTWTPSSFEKHLCEPVTPSMYTFMVGYICENMEEPKTEESVSELEEQAVNAYLNTPWQQRMKLHEEELEYLEETLDLLNEKLVDARYHLTGVDIATDEFHEVTTLINETERCIEVCEMQIRGEEGWVLDAPSDCEV